MLRIERVGKRLLAFRNLRQKPIAEFYDLTDFIVNSPDEFFGEIGERVFLIGTHANLSMADAVPVDLLGVDATGAGVAAVIQAAAPDSALSRAITAASRLASWKPRQFYESLSDARSRALRSFLGAASTQLNQRQRVFIIGEKADEELMSAAAWLYDRGVDIMFVETSLGVEPMSGAEYLRCHAFNPREARAASAKARAQPPFSPAEPHATAERAIEDLDIEAAPEPEWEEAPLDDRIFDPAADVSARRKEADSPERRSVEREPVSNDRVVEIEYAGRRLGAHLTNFSETGIGLEMNSPLPIGSAVTVIGEAEMAGASRPLHRKGRVRFCRFEEQGFRLGVAFEQA